MRGQAVPSNASASTNTGRENIVGVKVFPTLQFVWIQVSPVLSILSEQLGENTNASFRFEAVFYKKVYFLYYKVMRESVLGTKGQVTMCCI